MKYLSPAKVNLSFRVKRKREDGYHEIASHMQAISLFDTLYISQDTKDSFTCNINELQTEDNLVKKALTLFGQHKPVSIHLEKNIPTQAGLGGGSSNAATTLFALNELNGNPYSMQQLMEMGAMIGADVPFFFSLGTALCTGIGDILTPSDQSCSGWVVKPPFGVSTKNAYSHCVPREGRDIELFTNDLEVSVFANDSRMAAIKQELEQIFDAVVMTGSGSAFFCVGTITDCAKEKYVTFPVQPVRRNNGKWYDTN